MQNAARKIGYQQQSPKPLSGESTIEVHFDDSGFQLSGYEANVDDTLRLYNDDTGSNRITVYILTEDGQEPSMTLLQTVSSVEVSGGTYEDVVVKGSGTFGLSLDPAPHTMGGGRQVIISVPS